MNLRGVSLTTVSIGLLLASPALAAPKEQVLHVFDKSEDGSSPRSGILLGDNGKIFGTTQFGGAGQIAAGIVFELVPQGDGVSWKENILHNFADGQDGGFPAGSLNFDGHGNLLGTTTSGGVSHGVTYELFNPLAKGQPWAETVLNDFVGGTDGAGPQDAPLRSKQGPLFGTTAEGGTTNRGTVFMLQPPLPGQTAWTETVLYNFLNGADGGSPEAPVISDPAGNLYGTTQEGGQFGLGEVFMLSPPAPGSTSWTETTIFSFNLTDGNQPFGGLVRAKNGVLYGTTAQGGGLDRGVVFSSTSPAHGGAWKERSLHQFTGRDDGQKPIGAVLVGRNGELYGTASEGGQDGHGTVFRLSPPQDGSRRWTLKVLHAFEGGKDGGAPNGDLRMRAGTLYGTTAGDEGSSATVFAVTS